MATSDHIVCHFALCQVIKLLTPKWTIRGFNEISEHKYSIIVMYNVHKLMSAQLCGRKLKEVNVAICSIVVLPPGVTVPSSVTISPI